MLCDMIKHKIRVLFINIGMEMNSNMYAYVVLSIIDRLRYSIWFQNVIDILDELPSNFKKVWWIIIWRWASGWWTDTSMRESSNKC